MTHLPPLSDDFLVPPGVIYLDGNSLGLASRGAIAALDRISRSWADLAIQGWTEGSDPWFTMGRKLSGLLAPLLGADADEVLVGDSTTVRLHQILQSFYSAEPGRSKILIDALAFPSDRYAVESFLRGRGLDPGDHLAVFESADGYTLDENAIVDRLETDRSIALAVLPSVLYRSGQMLDMARIERAAMRSGVLVAWDCAHSAGVVDHAFRDSGVRLAFGCGYKWLNGGPGAPAWLYVARDLHGTMPGLAGWFGSDPARQFEMKHQFDPAADVHRFAIGTPHVLSAAPLLGSLETIQAVGIDRIRRRSLELTSLLRHEIGRWIDPELAEIVTPEDPEQRGGHIAVRVRNARAVSFGLRRNRVVPDFRPPDLIRLAPSPLYNSGDDCIRAVEILARLLRNPEELSGVADAVVT
ncbi:kynureninase [bacterium]|nr:kynureninase [bacterium]